MADNIFEGLDNSLIMVPNLFYSLSIAKEVTSSSSNGGGILIIGMIVVIVAIVGFILTNNKN